MLVDQWDIFVGALWTRFGSPSGGRDPEAGLPYDSGTEKEFRRAHHHRRRHLPPAPRPP